ncbi:HipA N-terminal domain-containing protein [Runella sp. SP2]|uniref:HipA N-terminal domain-containing protein n=1 Tax=Runella sp. SP2 TaxID=2268026 RepID=UPI000F08C55C|nr:HipA N-terminal domain-containing protein [Runella sp. SP2]AYQ31100.1 phosphatidylinositol kinase [Runella sp. SP2]
MNRSGEVYYQDQLAGIISEEEDGYVFTYEAGYLMNNDLPVSLTLPFFDGLIPEGWLLDIAIQNWKLNPRDRMGLLLTVCQDCLGAVSVKKIENSEP